MPPRPRVAEAFLFSHARATAPAAALAAPPHRAVRHDPHLRRGPRDLPPSRPERGAGFFRHQRARLGQRARPDPRGAPRARAAVPLRHR